MKHILILIFAMVLSCKGESSKNNSKEKPTTPNVFEKVEKSKVLVNMKGVEYKVEVNCAYFNEDYFYFKSDKLETTDTNGDGIVINGHQQNGKMVLTLKVDGNYYSTANLSIQKEGFTANGTGKLFSEDGLESFNTTYKVSCM